MGFYLTPLLINPFEKVTIFLGTKSFEKQNVITILFWVAISQ
jgi:hypothetical protein